MSITKVTFTKESAVQTDEMYTFLTTYASEYFESIIHPPDGDGKRHENIECTITVNGQTRGLYFNYYSNANYCTAQVYANSSLYWNTSNQAECQYGIATPNGIVLVFRSYMGAMNIGVSKTADGDTFIYMSGYSSNNITPRFANIHSGYGNSNGSFNVSGSYDNTSGFVNDTDSNSGTALTPMCISTDGSYSPYLLRCFFYQNYSERGTGKQMTLNGKKYWTNGYLALLDE